MKKMFEISIKLATEEHSTAIWEWRNDETARAMSLNQDFISWENHQNWYERILINKNRHIYVGYIEEILFGMVRFDKCKDLDNAYEVSINLDPLRRGKGLGKLLLAEAVEEFWRRVSDANLILAEIKKENKASEKLFESVGFQKQQVTTTLYKFSLCRV